VPGRPDDTAAASVPADEAIAALEERQLLLSALDAIDFEHRVVLVMHDIDEVPTTAIARVLEIPLNTVYSRLRVGRKQLANAVTKLGIVRGVR
jgi:RNA polymerase sigma-70 factor (ECF subfamily)